MIFQKDLFLVLIVSIVDLREKTGSALLATTNFMCHNPGPCYGKILYQAHISSQEMKEQGYSGKESKEKLTVIHGLTKLAGLLKKIWKGICDGSSTGNKSWGELLKKTVHNTANLYNCMWHKFEESASRFQEEFL